MSKTDQYNSEETIQALINEYAEKRTGELRDKVIACYEPYILKYVDLTCGKKDSNIYNPDTRKFLNMFITADKRNETDYPGAARKIIYLIRRSFASYGRNDMYNYIIAVFSRALLRYKPMIAHNTSHKKPISFTH